VKLFDDAIGPRAGYLSSGIFHVRKFKQNAFTSIFKCHFEITTYNNDEGNRAVLPDGRFSNQKSLFGLIKGACNGRLRTLGII
jgi:hypothetical protein